MAILLGPDIPSVMLHYHGTPRRYVTTLLFAYGSGKNFTKNKPGFFSFIQKMTQRGIFVATFHYRSWNEKNGLYCFEGSQLTDRLRDLEDAFSILTKYCPQHNIIVVGHSMGGPLVSRLVSQMDEQTGRKIIGSILLAPAAYSPGAWNAPFIEPFRNELKKGWDGTKDPLLWSKHSKPKLLIELEGDEVIPNKVMQSYAEHGRSSGYPFFHEVLSGTGHSLFSKSAEARKKRNRLSDVIESFTDYAESHA